MKRVLTSIGCGVVAAVAGIVLSLNPVATTALADDRYVALGDSVAAGLGLATADTSAEGALCGRTVEAYPVQVAKSLGVTVESFACSGAKADEGLYGSQDVNGTKLTPQLDRAFATGTPDVISITIGANDARWAQFVRDCYVWRCGSSFDDARAQVYLLDLRWELYQTLYQIWQRSGGSEVPRVILTGYFDPLEGQSCANVPNVTAVESAWLGRQVRALNQVIQDAAASATFATYAPVDFGGHGLCSGDSWVQGLQATAPMHPTAAGQTAIAKSVLAAAEQ